MRKNIIGRIILGFALAGLAAGCKKQLNVFPTTSEVDGMVITDAKSAATVLNGVYYRFANSGADNNDAPVIKWDQVSEWRYSQLCGSAAVQQSIDLPLSDHSYNATDGVALMFWTYGYSLVNAANGFLKNIDPLSNIPDASKKQMIAEARFLRAYANTYLLLNFGEFYDLNSAYGIVLRDAFVKPDNIRKSRSSVKEVYDFILADLSDAWIDALPDRNTKNFYTNKWAAKQLKARVLMNRGTADDYNQVISLTQSIIAGSPYTLEPNTKDIFWTKGTASNEVMLSVAPVAGQGAKYQSYLYYITATPSAFGQSLFANDPRNTWVYQTVKNRSNRNVLAFTKYYPGPTTGLQSMAITENGYAFRLSEAYLLQAEAITAAAGGNLETARTLLKTVMGRSGVTNFSEVDAAAAASKLREVVVKETMRNFICESGLDWQAMRRLPFATVQSWLPVIKAKNQLIFPIPQSEIKSNDLIQQTPGF
ncbi:RagB/SusD family nutrient uptake outer membrane protein [Niabella pedocola]|uniref:RagB/SusD family nutrient uptake outer membrane protein n=1 Tax=Niabella pedocola TaxID=1752077 RepID=A0ABS8PX87_9BACT|nr:RagB/SusD family nutrient uptake outer membrane protein [Niabella pedocola]MCD2424907.1 RagB/SusD family nutrient uptake outer membrane protein [Niabella pedocola]